MRDVGRSAGRALLAFAFLGLASPAGAEDWSRRASEAGKVVVATPVHQESRWEEDGIYTYTEVSVRRVAKGESERTVTLRQPGGVVGRIGQRVSHVRHVRPGRSYLLFLRPLGGGLWDPGEKGVQEIDEREGVEKVAGQVLETVIATLEAVR